MKTCTICKESLELSAFNKQKSRKDGLQTACRSCQKELRAANAETHKKATAAWCENNREARREMLNKASRKWNKNNKAKKNELTANRRAGLLKATPAWADKSAISYVYHAAQVLEKEYGTKWEVDHVVPLSSDVVCGLHTADNLQLLSRTDNARKSNEWFL
jgi:hypothetical protein